MSEGSALNVASGDGCGGNAEQSHEVIEVGAGPATKQLRQFLPGQREVTEDFRHAAREKASAELHLPESFLRVQVALGKKQIMLVGGKNMRDGVIVPVYVDGLCQAGDGQFAFRFGQRIAIEMANQGTQERRKDGRKNTAFRRLHKGAI